MNASIRQVNTTEDIAVVARLAATIWREYYVSIITAGQIDYMIDTFQSIPAITDQIFNQHYQYYLISADSDAIGYLSVKQENGKLFLSKLYIDKHYRGQGCASQAFQFLEGLCIDRQLSHIWLTVNRHNESSIAIYKKKGFRIIKEQVADIGNGYVMDDYVMEKAMFDPRSMKCSSE